MDWIKRRHRSSGTHLFEFGHAQNHQLTRSRQTIWRWLVSTSGLSSISANALSVLTGSISSGQTLLFRLSKMQPTLRARRTCLDINDVLFRCWSDQI